MKFENILEGLNFYDEVTIPEIIENNEDKIAFDKWEPVLPEEDATVTANMTFKAVFAEDENNNNVPDYRDTYFTVTFLDYDGTTIDSSKVLSGLSVTVPDNPEKESTAQYNYSFIGWYKGEVQITDFSNIQEDLTVTAKYSETVRTYTVTFVDHDDDLIETQIVEYGKSAIAPPNPTRDDYTFIKWDKAFDNITESITVKAIYEANLVGISAKERENAQLQFQVGSDSNIKDYIYVYKKYADGREVLAENNEYTTDFSTARVGDDIILTITLNEFTDQSLKYDITERPAYPTKFEVNYPNTTKYLECHSNWFSSQCDYTTTENTRYKYLEIIEHYDENISLSQVTAIYKNGNVVKLNISDMIRWSRYENGAYYDPVRLATRNDGDVMTSTLVIQYVDITYNRAGYGNFTIRFEYNADTNAFKAISEVQQ